MPVALSIVTPVYNGAKFLPDTIESILGQSFSNFEYILVDDGSSDESPAIMAAYAEKDPRIRIVTQKNAGIAGSRNRGFAEANSDIVAFLDHDDVALPERIKTQLDFLQEHPSIAGTGCFMEYMTEDGEALYIARHPHEAKELRSYTLSGDCPIPTTALMLRRPVALECGGLNPAYEPADDYEFLLRMLQNGYEFALVPEVLQRYRFMQANTSHQKAVSMMRCTLTAMYNAKKSALKVPRINESGADTLDVVGLAASLESMQQAATGNEADFWTEYFLRITTHRSASKAAQEQEAMLAIEYMKAHGCTKKRKCLSRIRRHLKQLSAWEHFKIMIAIMQ